MQTPQPIDDLLLSLRDAVHALQNECKDSSKRAATLAHNLGTAHRKLDEEIRAYFAGRTEPK